MMQASARQIAIDAPENPEALKGMNILVVDDSKANGDALGEMLQMEGATAVVEASAQAAIKRAEQERFDVIISDIAMPDIDGYAMLKAIRGFEANGNTPAIAYSGYGGASVLKRARGAGFNAHITKPVDVQKLLTVITDVAKRKRRAAD
jgi:two-component system CheB/CheR fusion protein